MKKIAVLTIALLVLGLVGGSVANADTPEVRAPDAPQGYREIGQGRCSGSSVDYSTEQPQRMSGGVPPLREIGYGACVEGEEGIYYTARCAEWGEWDPFYCHLRFWCRYLTPPQDGLCSGFPERTEAWWSWTDESTSCRSDPENGEAWKIVCRGGYRLVYHGYTHYCVRESWSVTAGHKPESCVGSIIIIGSAKTSRLIAKQWNGNHWDHPQYMRPAAVEEDEFMYWYAQYFLGPGPASFGLVERGENHGQDQNPVWIGKVEVVCGKYQKVTAYDEELRLPVGP